MSRDDYAALQLSFEGVCEQLEGIVRLGGGRHLELDAESIVSQACDDLRAIRDSSNKAMVRWEIPKSRPIRTKATSSYQAGHKGGLSAQAHLSFVWEVQKCNRRDEFSIAGLCSTRVVLVDTSDKLNGVREPVAWTFEMGSSDSPGCHFHTQIDWKSPVEQVFNEAEMQAWPSLDIPRLPSLLITPGDCLDYILGELFQDGWPKRYEETDTARIGRWLSSSHRRMTAILKNSLEAVEKSTQTSPWLGIKKWYPKDARILIG